MKTLLFKTITDYVVIKNNLQEIIDVHTCGPFKDSGSMILVNEPKFHLFTLAFKDDDARFNKVIKLFDKLEVVKIFKIQLRMSEQNYGDLIIYLTLDTEQKGIIKQIVKFGNVKKNSAAIVIGTIKENFDISIEKREEGLKLLLRQVYTYFKTLRLTLSNTQYLTI